MARYCTFTNKFYLQNFLLLLRFSLSSGSPRVRPMSDTLLNTLLGKKRILTEPWCAVCHVDRGSISLHHQIHVFTTPWKPFTFRKYLLHDHITRLETSSRVTCSASFFLKGMVSEFNQFIRRGGHQIFQNGPLIVA